MRPQLVILTLAAALALGISYSTIADVIDTDSDGVPDVFDNCASTANGPLASSGLCDSQEDGDLDGYGNPCDFDVDNDGATSLVDVSDVLDNMVLGSTDPNYDFDCDGATALTDLSDVYDNMVVLSVPGPSGLTCAGTPICVAF